MEKKIKIVLIAHDKKKEELANFIREYRELFETFHLMATKTTGSEIRKRTRLKVQYLHPERAAQELQLLLSRKEVDAVFFIRESVSLYFHELDLAEVNQACDDYGIPMATNLETARAMLASFTTAPEAAPDEGLPKLHPDLQEALESLRDEIIDALKQELAQGLEEIRERMVETKAVSSFLPPQPLHEAMASRGNPEELLLQDVIAHLYESQKVTAYIIRKKFNMGYSRAIKVLDELEQKGYIGPDLGKGPRQLYITEEQYLHSKGLA